MTGYIQDSVEGTIQQTDPTMLLDNEASSLAESSIGTIWAVDDVGLARRIPNWAASPPPRSPPPKSHRRPGSRPSTDGQASFFAEKNEFGIEGATVGRPSTAVVPSGGEGEETPTGIPETPHPWTDEGENLDTTNSNEAPEQGDL